MASHSPMAAGRECVWKHTPPSGHDQASTSGGVISELVRVLVIKRARASPSLSGFCVGLGRNGGAGCPSQSAEPVVGPALSGAHASGGQTALCNGIRTGGNKGNPAPVAVACCPWGTPCPRAPALADRHAPWPAQLSVRPIVRTGC